MKHRIKTLVLVLVIGGLATLRCMGQSSSDRTNILRDTLDGKLDFSSFIIDAKGFMPIAMIITEPALGGIGIGAGPVFLTPKKDAPPDRYVPPDITAGFGMYTANNSWLMGGARIGNIPKAGLKYRIGGSYGSINLSFYREISGAGEKEFSFNFKSLPIFGSVSKEIAHSNIYLGVRYLYVKNKSSPNFSGELPGFITQKELDNNTATLGAFLEIDKRNTIFTPDKGYRLNVDYSANDSSEPEVILATSN